MEPTIITVGDVSVDRFIELDQEEVCLHRNGRSSSELCLSYGEKVPVSSIFHSFGGSALNTAIGFSLAGITTSIATIVGNDEDGENILRYLHEKKVSFSRSLKSVRTNQSTILIYAGERTVLSYHEPRDYTGFNLSGFQYIYFASCGKGSETLRDKIIEQAQKGTRIFFNPGSWELNKFSHFAPMVKYSDIFILNRSESELIVSDSPIDDRIKEMEKFGSKINIITDGINGAYIRTAGRTIHMGAYPAKSLDPTGAGDGYASGFCAAYILGKSIEESAKWGMLNSASVVSALGANSGLMTARKLDEALAKAKSLKANDVS